jgi:two-component system, OmpR family, response regulator MprA
MEWSEASPGRPILVVDDEEVIRDTLADILAAQGYPVQTASNGAEALEAIQEERPSIVVTDVHMPRMDGVELVEQLHQRGYDPPIVVVTGTRATPMRCYVTWPSISAS